MENQPFYKQLRLDNTIKYQETVENSVSAFPMLSWFVPKMEDTSTTGACKILSQTICKLLSLSLTHTLVCFIFGPNFIHCSNISAFISNLPTPPGVTKTLDTKHFSTRDSSGSTSQASNVVEAIELGAKALLVDEDIRYVQKNISLLSDVGKRRYYI